MAVLLRAATLTLVALVTMACGDGTVTGAEPEPEPEPQACEDPLAVALSTGECLRPGLSAEQCAAGFEHDGMYGCVPVLPAEPCPPGLMAVPGDEVCRSVMECPAGPWPDLPADATTQYVLASADPALSNGSVGAPWTTINDAIDAAPSGGTVLVGAGVYPETVFIFEKRIVLHGLCPDQVIIDGQGGETVACFPTALCVAGPNAAGSEIHGVTLTGQGMAATVNTVDDVLFERVHIRDSTDRGIGMGTLMDLPTSLVLRDSLIEQTGGAGIVTQDSAVVVERSAIARITPLEGFAVGIRVRPECAPACDELRASATLDGSLIESTTVSAMSVIAADAVLRGSVIRDTLPHPETQTFGRGINAIAECDIEQVTCDPLGRSTVRVEGSMIERAQDFGIFAGVSDVVVEGSTIRDTLPRASDGRFGVGVLAQGLCVADGPTLTCEPSSSTATLIDSVLTGNHALGASASGSVLEVVNSYVADTQPEPFAQSYGIGLSAQVACVQGASGLLCDPEARGSLSLARSLVERSHTVGVALASVDGVLTESVVRDTLATTGDGLYGDGVVAMAAGGTATISLTDMRVVRSARVGVSSFGATGAMAGSEIHCAAIPFNVEDDNGMAGVITDGGDNRCGCPEDDLPFGDCKAVSASVSPPIIGTGKSEPDDGSDDP